MNAAIRAVVRAGIYYKFAIVGIFSGYQGMIKGKMKKMNVRSVANIIHRGGTILQSARSEEFRTRTGRKKAIEKLKKNKIDALVAIGGDGTFRGAITLNKEYDIPIIGIPGTIDNDLFGTDATIGYDTATNTAVKAIDMIRDTALSHNRLFFIEVMGRDSGFIAMRSGIAGGAVATIIPEDDITLEELVEIINKGLKSKKSSSLVVVAEGGKLGGALQLAEKVKEKFSYFEPRVTILGHIQRGGSPTVFDRLLASRLGVAAIEALKEGKSNVMAGIKNSKIVFTPFQKSISTPKIINQEAWRIAKILSS